MQQAEHANSATTFLQAQLLFKIDSGTTSTASFGPFSSAGLIASSFI